MQVLAMLAKKEKKEDSVGSKPGLLKNPRGEGPLFYCEVQLKVPICACELVTNNSNNVVFKTKDDRQIFL